MTFEEILSEIRASGLKRSEANIPDEKMQQLQQTFYKIGTELLSIKGVQFDPTLVSTHIDELIFWTLGKPSDSYSLLKGFLYKGPTGTGKTLLMRMYAHFLRGLEYRYGINRRSYPLRLQIVSARKIAGMYCVKGYNLIEEMANPDLYPMLCIDDIGAEIISQNNYGNHMSAVNEILERRHSSQLPTFGTTNLNSGSSKDGYDDRILRRIDEMFNIKSICNVQKQNNQSQAPQPESRPITRSSQ